MNKLNTHYFLAFSCAALFAFNISSASADVLCQKKSQSRIKPVQSVKVFKGDKCPKGHSLIMQIFGKSDVEQLTQSFITQNISTLTGDTGVQGEVGEKGDKGDKGDQGEQGPEGIQGLTGEKGDKGDTGEKGDKGDTGSQGDQGIQGEKGDTGDKGETGDTGEKGEKGDTGAKGDTGDTGAAGANGIVNINACYTTTLSRTGSQEETQTVFCNDAANEYVHHVGFSTTNINAQLAKEVLEFEKEAVLYTHPVGATVSTSGPLSSYTLSATIFCCPIN